MRSFKWYHAALIASGAVSVGALLYYLMREETTEKRKPTELKGNEKLDINKATKAQVLDILQQVIISQEKMKAVMKDLTKELMSGDFGFDEVYQKVKAVQPADPLEASGLSMTEFDVLLNRFHEDADIREVIAKIMGAPDQINFSTKINTIRKEKIVEVHDFMLRQLKAVVEQFERFPKKDQYNMKTVTIAVQAIVSAKVEKEYNLSSEDIEAAVLLHHQSLASDLEFGRINVAMQSTMSDLLGTQFPSSIF